MSCPPDFQSRAVGVDAANQTLSHRPECQASETGALGPLILRCQWFCGTFYWLRSDEVAPRYHIGGKRVKAGRTVFPFYHQHGLWETWVNMSWLYIIHHTPRCRKTGSTGMMRGSGRFALGLSDLTGRFWLLVTGKHLSAGSTASSSDASAFVVGELSKEGFCTLIQYAERTAVR